LPEEVIARRFNLRGNEGVVIEAVGTITEGMVGTAFLYTNRESISIGIGCLVSNFVESGTSPYALLDRFKQHPSIEPLLAGSEVKEYSAHLIPEGGYKAIPDMHGDGWLVVGDAGHLVNSVHREGSNLAMTSGRIAGETIAALKAEGLACSRKNLGRYWRTLEQSYVIKDMRKYRKVPGFMHKNRHLFTVYPRLMSHASQAWIRVDGTDKLTKERGVLQELRKARGFTGMVGDAFRMMRAWR
jgi:electron transfer flavoprotein-quinone oxidoreductase